SLPKARQALSMGIDRSKISVILHREMTDADSLMSDELFPQGKASVISFDAQRGAKLLKEAAGDPKTLPKLELVTFATDENALLSQFIQDQLAKNLGLNVSISMLEYATYRSQIELQSGALYFRCWAADYADPDTFFSVFLSTSGNNYTSWKNARYDELVKGAAATPNGPERVKMYKEALDILLRKDVPIVPLYFDTLTYLLNDRVKNFVISPLNYVFFRDIVIGP
ncbi:MAG: hypothetical protein HY075_15055, partial [Deltaproteobacteria bacterium]|nr:hypothetical protein [Deltaproteobacteria bacterium]